MQNAFWNDLRLDICVSPALESEPAAVATMLKCQSRKHLTPRSLGADKGYHSKDVVACLRRKSIAPHIAQIDNRTTPGQDARTTRHASYWISQKKRKRVGEIFGWMKAYGGLRRMRMYDGATHGWDRCEPDMTINDPFAHEGRGGPVAMLGDAKATQASVAAIFSYFSQVLKLQ